MTEEVGKLRARVAELEVALKYFLDRTWFYLISDTLPDSDFVSMDARVGDLRRAASLISQIVPERTPEQRAAFDQLLRDDGELYDVGGNKLSEKALEAALLAGPIDDDCDFFDTVAGFIAMSDEENRMVLRSAITAYLSALKAEGMVIVPSEPTEAMMRSAIMVRVMQENQGYKDTAEIYRAMLSAHEDGK
jgi:hypothetical protein